MSTLTVPADLVDLLREALVVEFAGAAAELADADQWPTGLDAALLEPFDACRALLEGVGWTNSVPPVAVTLTLTVSTLGALSSALRNRLEHERDTAAAEGAVPGGEANRRRAQRNATAIQACLAGLGNDEDALGALGRTVRRAREEQGITPAALAEAAGVAPGRLAALEAGRFDPPYDVLCAVAAGLGVGLGALVTRAEGPEGA